MDKCDYCNKYKEDVKYVLDPYAAEIHDEEMFIYLCDDCYQEFLEEI